MLSLFYPVVWDKAPPFYFFWGIYSKFAILDSTLGVLLSLMYSQAAKGSNVRTQPNTHFYSYHRPTEYRSTLLSISLDYYYHTTVLYIYTTHQDIAKKTNTIHYKQQKTTPPPTTYSHFWDIQKFHALVSLGNLYI